jgi:hypothetical protein
MAAHIAHRDDITVREFISEFRGITGTAKQKRILAETGASLVSLHSFFGIHKANTKNIAKLLASLKQHTKPVRPADLGLIGKEHLYALMERAGGDPKTFTYNRSVGETGGISRVVEFGFGIHRDGLGNAGHEPRRKAITGVNWSSGINNPFRQLGRGGEGLDGILSEVRANTAQPIIAVLHLACRASLTPTAASRRLSSRATIRRTMMAKKVERPRNMAADIIGVIREGTKKWTRTVKAEERSPASRSYRYSRMTRERGVSFKEAAEQIMESAYLKVSGNGKYPANARQIMYAARPHIQKITGRQLHDSYFTQTLLPDYLNETGVAWDVV